MSEKLVDRYLRDLREDIRDLPRSRQEELVAEIKEHIDSAGRGTGGGRGRRQERARSSRRPG